MLQSGGVPAARIPHSVSLTIFPSHQIVAPSPSTTEPTSLQRVGELDSFGLVTRNSNTASLFPLEKIADQVKAEVQVNL